MRIIEEIKSVRLQVISLLGLIVTTILLQIGSYKIDNFNRDITIRALDIVILAQRRLYYYELGYQFGIIKSALPFESIKFHEDYWSDEYIDKEAKQFKDEYEKGLLNAKEYIKKSTEHQRATSNKLRKELNEKIEKLNTLLSHELWWEPISRLLFLIQIVAVCILAIGYLDLIGTISKRAFKSKKEE